MDTKLKEALKSKDCPLIYAAYDNGIEISYKGSVKNILSLISTLMFAVSDKSGIPLDSLFVTMISKSTEALKELEEEYEELNERKVGKN